MRQYKVVYVDHDGQQIYDSEHRWNVGNNIRKGQEDVLNYYAKLGWRLVTTVSGHQVDSFGAEMNLYLEREI